MDDWLEAGEKQLIKSLPFKALVNINQAGRVGQSLDKTGILLTRELGDTDYSKLFISLKGSQAHRGLRLSLRHMGESFPCFSRPAAMLFFVCLGGALKCFGKMIF